MTRSDFMIKWGVYALAILPIWFLEVYVLNRLPVLGVTPMLMPLAAVAAGADGLINEVHNDPAHAKCDGQQSLTPQNFDALMHKVSAMVDLMGKTLVK